MATQQPTLTSTSYAIQPPALGATILYRGLGDVIGEGVVTQLRHIETKPDCPDKWGAFLDTPIGPIFIHDWRYLRTR